MLQLRYQLIFSIFILSILSITTSSINSNNNNSIINHQIDNITNPSDFLLTMKSNNSDEYLSDSYNSNITQGYIENIELYNNVTLDDIQPNLVNSNSNNINNNNSNNENSTNKLIENQENITKKSIKLFNKADLRKRKIDRKSIIVSANANEWKCPTINHSRNLECGCDMPHTLRCSGDLHGLEQIANGLRNSIYSVSLLDCTLKNVTFLSDAKIFENVSLHGLVISSGEIKRVHRSAFLGLANPIQALGLPNNALVSVPYNALAPLTSLDRLDLSNNRIKTILPVDFSALSNLTYLELSENQIGSISSKAFVSQKKLITLKLNGNRLGDYEQSLQAIGQCLNLRELNLQSNGIKGPLSHNKLPKLTALESLNLDKNVLTSIQNSALQAYPYLITLSARHNQIDVLQDNAFNGLSLLQVLDLGYNGIVAVSSLSLKHLPRLLVLDLTHNFLRALTSDLIEPLPSLKELRLDGNDISIVAKTALDGASELHSLSLQDNPLSCDCTLKPFAEWLYVSRIPSSDLLGAICATPPHLEGAPLLQIPIESLSCDSHYGTNNNDFDNGNVLEQLEALSKQSNLSYVKDFSDVITLKKLHLSTDYGLILTWSVNLRNDEFTCDAVFVYKETNINEILLDSSPIHCESYTMENENIVSVILRDTTGLTIGESYRFCLVLIQEKNVKRDLVVGCSNITKLEVFENSEFNKISRQNQPNLIDRQLNEQHKFSDISTIDKVTSHSHDNDDNVDADDDIDSNVDAEDVEEQILFIKNNRIKNSSIKDESRIRQTTDNGEQQRPVIFSNINRNFLPGLGLGILITSIFVLIWGAIKLKSSEKRHQNHSSSATTKSTCYATNPNETLTNLHEHEHRSRYLKLQATTSL